MPEPLIIQGDARHIPLPDKCVQCVCCSPPYWGLRRYEGVEPTVWGGRNGCEHVWGRESRLNGPKKWNTATGQTYPNQTTTLDVSQGQFCSRCGAWRGLLGLEPTPDLFVEHLVKIFREVRRVLRDDGCVWLNLGSSYASCDMPPSRFHFDARAYDNGRFKQKDLIPIPWMVAMALQTDGWYLRQALPWVKRSAMPESTTDRPASAIEYVFLLTPAARYFYDAEAVRVVSSGVSGGACFGKINREADAKAAGQGARRHSKAERERYDSGRNFRNTDLFFSSIGEPHGLISAADGTPLALDVNPQAYSEAHFATFPEALVLPLVRAGTSERGCCPTCGKPWERVVEKGSSGPWHDHSNDEQTGQSKAVMPNRDYTAPRTVGWRPGCECGGEPIPCLVLDPFAGSGTTLAVAAALGRRAVGIEPSSEYIVQARDRIGRSLHPATYVPAGGDGEVEAPLFTQQEIP